MLKIVFNEHMKRNFKGFLPLVFRSTERKDLIVVWESSDDTHFCLRVEGASRDFERNSKGLLPLVFRSTEKRKDSIMSFGIGMYTIYTFV